MKPTPTILTLLSLLAACGLAPAQQKDTTPTQNKPNQGARHASAILKITCDPSVLPLSHELIETLLRTSGVAGEAARETLGMAGDLVREHELDHFTFSPLDAPAPAGRPTLGRGGGGRRSRGAGGVGGGPGGGMGMGAGGMMGGPMGGHPIRRSTQLAAPGVAIMGTLNVTLPEDKAIPSKAAEFLQALCERLKRVLHQAWEAEREPLAQQLGSAEEERERADQELAKLQAMRRTLSNESGESDLDRDRILEKIRALETDKAKLEMELAGQNARREAVQERIAAAAGSEAKAADQAHIHQLMAASQKARYLLRKAQSDLERLSQLSKGKQSPAVNKVELDAARQVVARALAERDVAEIHLNAATAAAKQQEDAAAAALHRAHAVTALVIDLAERVKSLEREKPDNSDELIDAKAMLRNRRAEQELAALAVSKQKARRAAVAPQLGRINAELADISISTADAQARLKHVNEKLESIQARKLLELADQYEREVAIRLPLAKLAFEEAAVRLDDLRRLVRNAPGRPTVVVLGMP